MIGEDGGVFEEGNPNGDNVGDLFTFPLLVVLFKEDISGIEIGVTPAPGGTVRSGLVIGGWLLVGGEVCV